MGAEKEEEFIGVKKNMGKALEGMQNALEQESKGKGEAIRMKKKLEADVSELEMSLEHANANNFETQKAIKKYQGQIRDAQTKLEDEQRGKAAARDMLVNADRKAHSMQNALEEARTLLEQADRNRRTLETELSDVNEQLSDATVQNQSLAAAKRKLESEMQTLQGDYDEMAAEAKLCEEKQLSQWSMPQDLPMSSELNRIPLKNLKREENCWKLNPRTCSNVWMRPRPMLSKEERRP